MAPERNAVVQRMRDAIADDLDTPRVVAIVDEWVSTPPAAGDADVVALVDALLGLDLTTD
ncbi:hypothetical protein [Pseudoclavibacter terrae]|uniref:hypothetical protein n=1 Tax=Pseudoclavibacter terrae TaxID=1530195 RepID=UPI00233117C9|nr:hypothetical protein [Pseudoclavibacter terrae]